MLHRFPRIPSLLAVVAVLGAPAPARALDHPGSLARALLAPEVDGSVAVIDRSDEVRRQREIYRILCGGAAHLESGVSRHLWRVAESLAVADWQPPRVTIRVVVRELERL